MRWIRLVKNELSGWKRLVVMAWPATSVGYTLRINYWTRRYHFNFNPKSFGRMTEIYGHKENLFLGKDFVCGDDVTINFCDSKGIYIGNNVSIAKRTYIRTGNHRFDKLDVPVAHQGHTCETLEHAGREYSAVIEDDVLIGAGVTILSGTKLGKGCIVAAGSVLATEFPPYSIVAGNPARVFGNRLKNQMKEKPRHVETN